ncbi:ankyrin repeat protein [Paraburkholderia fungorum]|jgi:hypothetical protein|uniref:ankyrin repeat domain-containing protein n=1 Tax=Paraburkholderia fungorum TaxID=134537 RepID=UPI000D078576|nr:ankyrin repeat domain-containing protein [Paraburkholderia fungorum]PRZ56440.1 ankyrin repeat protein [Paraburkholderia fungorum]
MIDDDPDQPSREELIEARTEALFGALSLSDLPSVIELADAETTSCLVRGKTPLMHAADHSSLDCIQALLPFGNIPGDNYFGTALHIAAIEGRADVVRILLPHSDPRGRDYEGETPLMWAAQSGAVDVVEILLPFSDPLAINDAGQSALARAAEARYFECADALAPHSNPVEVAKLFKEVGSEKMPQWAARLAAQAERKELHAEVARAEAAQARPAVATMTPQTPTNKPAAKAMRL